jgi:hypothetical protein
VLKATETLEPRLGKGFRPLDAVVALALIFAALQAWPAFQAGPGRRAEIHGSEKVLARLTLGGPARTLSVEGALGSVTVEYGAQGVRFVKAPCPGQVCVRRGWVSRTGASSACLPSRVRVVIQGVRKNGDGQEIDAETW